LSVKGFQEAEMKTAGLGAKASLYNYPATSADVYFSHLTTFTFLTFNDYIKFSVVFLVYIV